MGCGSSARPGDLPRPHRLWPFYQGNVRIHLEAGTPQLRRLAATQTRLYLPESARGGLHRRRQPRTARPGAGVETGGDLVSGRLQHLCLLQPKEELGATQHRVQTSNRRFRDDEFLIPRDLTEGRSAIRVRIRFTPVKRPLFPGHPLPELAWSEIRYTAYCWVMPETAVKD